jgi:hypothetical protein
MTQKLVLTAVFVLAPLVLAYLDTWREGEEERPFVGRRRKR